MPKPLLALTLGDPAGVGPETIAGAWTVADVHRWCRPFVVGHPEILRRAVRLRGIAAEVVSIDSPEQADPTQNRIPCLFAGPENAAVSPLATLNAPKL